MFENSQSAPATGFGAHWRSVRGYPVRAFTVCLIAYAFSQMDLALFGYAVPLIREEFDLTLQQMGYLISGSFLLGGILIVGLSVASDRFGRKTMMMGATVVSSLLIAAHAIAPGALVLGLLRGLAISTGGLLYPVTGAIMAETAPARLRGIMNGLMQTGYPLGWLLAYLLAEPLIRAFGWRGMFVLGLLSLPYIFVIAKFLREGERFEAAREKRREREQAAKTARTPEISAKHGLAALFAPGQRSRTLILFTAQFLFVVAYGGSIFWFTTYFAEAKGFTLESGRMLVGLGNGIGIAGYILAAVIGEFYLTRRTTVVIWTLLGASAFLWLIWGTSTESMALLAFGVMSMFFYGTAAVKFAYIAELFPTGLRATGIAVCGSLAVTLGTATGPFLVPFAVDLFGWDIAFSTVLAIPLFVAGMMYLVLEPIPSGLEVEEVDRRLNEKKETNT